MKTIDEQTRDEVNAHIVSTTVTTLRLYGRDNAAREKAFMQAKIDAGHPASDMMQIRVDAYTALGV